ncbi:MAG: SpaH/EbpB family LPXTG-anchored major pilin [Actinomycetia bacterium]|nr:SpaH/EbpB family LPXTG-anchored major pilin [Actinomycetes bacterium]
MRKRPYRFAAAVLAAAALTMGPATLANAEPAPNPQQTIGGANQANTANPALINPNAATRLTIHKYLGSPTGAPNDGTILQGADAPTHPTLSGVRFDVFRVLVNGTPVDLTTNAGWEQAAELTGAAAQTLISTGTVTVGPRVYTLATQPSVTTGAGGIATFDGRVGLYLVEENLEASGTITDSAGNVVPNGTITSAAPFLVTLPMTHPTNLDTWMYDVHVYPKNQNDVITKAVEDKGTVTADNDENDANDHQIDYTITTSVTEGTAPLGMYTIYDNLHPSLTLIGGSVALSDGTQLVRGTHYDVFVAGPEWGTPFTQWNVGANPGAPVAGGPVVSVVMTAAGRAVLEANRSLNVVTTINTLVDEMDADGVKENDATFIPNDAWWEQHAPEDDPDVPGDPWDPNDPDNPDNEEPPGNEDDEPGIPSNEVESRYGNVNVIKYDPQDANAPMDGAVFEIFWATEGAVTCTDANVSGDPIATATVGADNTAVFQGLQTSNFYNGAPQNIIRGFCIVETMAPEGYNLDANPRFVQIDYRTATETTQANAGTVAFADLRVANEKTNLGNSLPLTGGAGVAGMSILGLLLVGGGIAYTMKNRRREDVNA